MLSEKICCFLLFFLEDLYNIPTDLMFHWKTIYKFEVLCENSASGSLIYRI